MSQYLIQDPAGDAGRRAARSGKGRSGCPYPADSALGRRWLKAWETSVIAQQEAERAAASCAIDQPAKGAYSPAETRQVYQLLVQGKKAPEIAAIMHRQVHSVQVKIGRIQQQDLSESEDNLLTAMVGQGYTITRITRLMKKGRGTILRATARLGLEPRQRNNSRRWSWRN